jgi:hypothetical protein
MNSGRARSILVVFGIFLMLLALYVTLNTGLTFRFEEKADFMNYDMLSDAFLTGQLYLKKEVDPGRLKSEDPLNPATPYPFMFDAIIWNGRYYFHQEPFPAVIHALWTKLTGLPCRTGPVVVLVSMGTLVWLGILLLRLREIFFGDSPGWVFWYTWLSFALSGAQLYMAGRPVVYNEAVGMGAFFVLAGFTVLVYAFTAPRLRLWLLVLSGVFFGLAVACRAMLVLYPLSFAACYILFSIIRKDPPAVVTKVILSFGIPVALFVSMLFAYNYLRFGNILDFGKAHIIFPKFQDYAYCILEGNFFRLAHVPHHLYHYLLALPELSDKFPFVTYTTEHVSLAGVYIIREMVCSVFILVPSLLLALPVPLVFRYRSTDRRLLFIITLCMVSCITVLLFLTFFVGAAVRYLYDFTPLLFVLVYCNLATIWRSISGNPTARRLLGGALCLLFVFNGYMGLTLAMRGTWGFQFILSKFGSWF